jgi:hypothetical protein
MNGTERDLTIDDFAPHRRQSYALDHEGAQVELRLEKVQELPKRMREAGSFRLEFRGPNEPMLEQAIYRLARGDEAHDIFIVPIARDEESTTYEAVFN